MPMNADIQRLGVTMLDKDDQMSNQIAARGICDLPICIAQFIA